MVNIDQYKEQHEDQLEERWEASEIEVLSPDTDEDMHFSHLDDEHDRVLFVRWD